LPKIEDTEMIIVQENTVLATASPNNPIKPIIYADLLNCFIDVESSGNDKAFNPHDTDGRPKYGCLQFDLLTFDSFCVKKYNLVDNIWDCDVQSYCWQEMYLDGLVGHWGNKARNTCL
jgi:hypothetical protein